MTETHSYTHCEVNTHYNHYNTGSKDTVPTVIIVNE